MKRGYKCLSQLEFKHGAYKLVPIRDEDKYQIMQWRNEQIHILRQKEPLTKEKQEWYFKNVVDKLFVEEKPGQLLFSFLENDVLIGYGGLVHIDWESRNGEISFITATERAKDNIKIINDWKIYLMILKALTATQLGFTKIYTYAYGIRSNLFPMLIENNFMEEGRLKSHIAIQGEFHDVLIHSFFFNKISLRIVKDYDLNLLFEWANDEDVRRNSFIQNKIEFEQHQKWFNCKMVDSNCLMLIATVNINEIGQIRFDKTDDATFEIDFSIDRKFRGNGAGSELIKMGTAMLLTEKPSVQRVVGRVKRDNYSSNKSFLKAGFKLIEMQDQNMYFFER